jgi:Zn-dependent peptidase ImmA (M78 family)
MPGLAWLLSRPNLSVYSPHGMASKIKTEAAAEAAQLLEVAWPQGIIPVDPVTIARGAGIRVLEAQLQEDTLGALLKTPGEDPTIVINETDAETRKRFTCAHELGHWVRRSNDDEYSTVDLRSDLSRTGQDEEEIFANEFAASLLMPEKEFRVQHALGRNAVLLGIAFKVSAEAAEIRKKNLGLA